MHPPTNSLSFTQSCTLCVSDCLISYQGCKKILSIRTGGRFSRRKDNQSNISTYCCCFITHRRHFFFFCLHELILIKWLFLNYIQQRFFSLYSSYKCKSMGYRLDLYPCKLHDCMYGVQKISCCSQK